MKDTPPDYQLLATFVAVAEYASFSKAAQKLGVGKGTVSRSIARLEEELGTELLHRNTHQVSLSTAGTALYERTAPHFAALQKAIIGLPELDEEPAGLLRITAPHDFGAIILPSIVASFALRYPQVRFDIRLTQENVDLVNDGYDLAIRVVVEPLKDSTLMARRLGAKSPHFYAAPSYIARRGKPKFIGEERHTWVLHHAAMRFLKIPTEVAQFVANDFLLVRDLLRDGVGVGLLPDFVARSYVQDKLLETITLTDIPEMVGQWVLLYPSSGQIPKKVAAFRDYLVEAMRAY